MMIGGAGFSTLSAIMLNHEGLKAMGDDAPTGGIGIKFIQYLGFGGVLVGLSVYQIEFDFGVPQFRQVFQPMLIAAAAALALVAARIMLGRGAAIIAALLAIVLRGGVALVVGPILGAPINWFALYLGPAIVVELIGLTPLIKRPIIFGAVSGLGVATIGLWLESLWVDAVYHYPWPTSMWPEALAMAIPVAVLTGACGAMFGLVLTSQTAAVPCDQHRSGGADGAGHRRRDGQRTALPRAAERHGDNHSRRCARRAARVSGWWTPTCGSTRRTSSATTPTGCRSSRGRAIWRISAARWSPISSKVGPGHYRTTEAVPVWGTWKTLLRVHDGKTLTAVPIYLAADPGIGAKEVPARGVDDPAVRCRDHHPAARAQPRDAGGAVDGRLPGGSGSARWSSSAASVGAQAGSTAARPSGSKAELQPTAQA